MKTTNLAAIKNGEEFTWGEVVKIHEIGIYSVVEYKSQFHKKNIFHPYAGERDLHHGCYSLEEAIVTAIAINKDGANSQAAYFFMKMIS